MCLLSQYLFLEVARFQICNLFRLYGFFCFFFFCFNIYYIIFYLRRSPNVCTCIYWCCRWKFFTIRLFFSLSLSFFVLILLALFFWCCRSCCCRSFQFFSLCTNFDSFIESCCFFAVSLLDFWLLFIVFMKLDSWLTIMSFVLFPIDLSFFSTHRSNPQLMSTEHFSIGLSMLVQPQFWNSLEIRIFLRISFTSQHWTQH